MVLHNLKPRFSFAAVVAVFLFALTLGMGAGLYAQEMDESTPAPSEITQATPKKKSKDFQKTITAKKAAQQKAAAAKAVKSSDLMDAMKQSINPAPVVPLVEVPPAAPTAPEVTPPALATPETEKLPDVTPPLVEMPKANLPPVIEGEKPRKLFSAQPKAPVKAVEPEASLIPPPPVPETPKETPKAAETSTSKTEEPKVEVKKDTPTGAPLLSDMNEAPNLLGSDTPLAPATPKAEEKKEVPAEKPAVQAASAEPEVPPGFAKPRALFSSEGKKRKGVKRFDSMPAPMPVEAVPAQETLPPLETREVHESIIKPTIEPVKENKNSIWKAAAPVDTKGDVVYSQNADGSAASTPSAETREEPAVNVEEKPTYSAMPEGAAEVAVPQARLSPSSSYNPAAGPMLHASCGAASGVGTDMRPANYLCTQGNATAVTGSGPWNWTCQGSNGGTNASCSAPLQVNGECGMANGSQSASAPIGQLCKSGTATGVTGPGPWYWSCLGDNGGVVAQCVAYTLVSGACGAAHNVSVEVAPSNGLCNTGIPTAVLGDGPWTWNCVGSGEGTTTNCMAPVRVSGVCGTASGVGFANAPSSNLCASGTASTVKGNGPWTWNCIGEGNGGTASCSATTLTNASCGAAHGIGTDIMPQAALCNSGTASAVTGNGPWMWTCYGENGGAPSDCLAPLKINGMCGPAHQMGAADKPASGLCSAGTASQVSGSGPWQWTCMGAAGGITANCIAQPMQHAACGPAHGVSVPTPPTTGLCNDGTPTSVIGSGPFLWSCQGTQGGAAANCMAPLQVNGACGAADSMPVQKAPVGGLCASGKESAVTGNGPWIWTCQGAGGGISTTCQAPLAQAEKPAEAPAPAQVPKETAKAGNECTPSVKRWTITCQQGGYPSNYSGVIVGETQVLCPTGVERGVWLSNSCAPATNSAPVSPSPGVLEVPPPPSLPKVMEKLPDMKPLPAKDLAPPRKLATPRFKGDAVATAPSVPSGTSLAFAPSSEGLDGAAVSALDNLAGELADNEKSIITLSAYAAASSDGSQQESRRLALARALAVRSYLMRKGIASTRIDVRAVGPASDGLGEDRVDINVK